LVIIDFHVHIDKSENANVNGSRVKIDRVEILNRMEEAGIDISVLLVMAKKGDMAKTQAQNDWLSDICRENSHFLGFGSVHPEDGSATLEEMNRCVKELKLKGFKLHPDIQEFDCGNPAVIQVLKQAAELDVPVLIDSYSPFDNSQPSKLLNAILSSPETKVCLAHVGLFRFMDFGVYGFLKQRIRQVPINVYFDLSCSATLFYGTPLQEQFCWITKQIGPDNLLFGSDFPGPLHLGSEHPWCSTKFALEAVRNFGYPKDWIPRIIGGNAAKLLKL
jgi:predicted TIM-barrel fold metal-dependent hydrolase